MKRILLALGIVISFLSQAQTTTTDRTIIRQSVFLRDKWVDSVQNDTNFSGRTRAVPTSDAVKRLIDGRIAAFSGAPTAIGFNAATGDLTIDRNGMSTLSKNLDGRYALLANAATNENYLASPGVVTWSGTGLTFDVTPALYYINGQQYNSSAASITLSAADPTNPRIDVIAVDNTGAVVKLTGTPAVNPVKPQIDPTTQVELTFIPVGAGATTPAGVTTTLIYNENVEWSLVPQGITIDANNATAFNGTKAISTSGWSNQNQLTFVNGAVLQPANYVSFKMFVRLKSTLANNTNITVTLANGSTIVSNEVFITGYGLSKSTVGSYQNISIPFSALNPTGTFDRVRVRFTGSNSSGVYIDYVQLQNGVAPPPSTALQAAYAQMTDGTNTSQSTGADKFKFRSSDNTITPTVTNNDATHGDNVNLTVNGANVTGVPQSGVTGLTSSLAAKEDAANKSTATTLGTSNTFFPTQNAVKVYVDNAVGGVAIYTDEQAQDAIGAMVSSEFTYNDATPSLSINTIAQSKVTNLVSDLAGKQATLSSGVNIKTVNGNSLLGSGDVAIAGGSSNTFSKGLTENAGAVSLGQAPVTATNADYTVSATDYFIKLPVITANRVLNLPDPTTNTGRHLVIWSANTAAFTWTFNPTTFGADGSSTNGGTMNNTSFLELVSDGTNWVRQSGSGITTRSGSGSVAGVNQSELQLSSGSGISIGTSSSGNKTTYTPSLDGWVGSISKPGDADKTWNATITDILYSTTLTANRTVTMGTAISGNGNRKVTITNSQTAAFNVILSSTSGINFKGAAFSTIAPGESVTLMSDNATWQVIEYHAATVTNTFSNGLTNNGGAVSLGQSPTVATDANYAITASDYYIVLPAITAPRTITLPTTGSTTTGRQIIFQNKNTSGSTWNFVGTVPVLPDGAATPNSTLPNGTTLMVVSDGTNWVRVDNSYLAVLKQGTTTFSGDVTWDLGTTNEISISSNQASINAFTVSATGNNAYGILSSVSTGAGAAMRGTQSASGPAGLFSASSGKGIDASSSSNTAVAASSSSGTPVTMTTTSGGFFSATQNGTGTNDNPTMITYTRSGGTTADGFGMKTVWQLEDASGALSTTNNSSVYWNDATNKIPILEEQAFIGGNTVTIKREIPLYRITADATPSTQVIKITNFTTGLAEVTLIGVQGSPSSTIAGKKIVKYRKSGGTLTLGTITTLMADDADGACVGATWTIVNSGNDLGIQVTGNAATSITWRGTVRIIPN